MAVYGNVKCKVLIHDANTSEEDGATGTMARDIKDYVDTLDSTNSKVLSISHVRLRGDRVLTVVIGGA